MGILKRIFVLGLVNSGLFLILRFLLPETEELSLALLLLSTFFFYFEKIAFTLTATALVSAAHIWGYYLFSRLRFNLWQVLNGPIDAIESVIHSLNEIIAILLVVEFAAAVVLIAWVIRYLIIRTEKSLNPRWLYAISIFVTSPAAVFAVDLIGHHAAPVRPIKMHFSAADVADFPQRDESLIILQLESLNGHVLFEKTRPRIPLPGLQKLIEQGGIWFPHFWSNTFGTLLGMSSILCGSEGAMTSRLVSPPEGVTCLPERFRQAGFKTAFYYSYRDARFYDMFQHVKKLGFENFYFGENLMKPGDPNLKWGYDDCRFYQRAFEHLKGGLNREKKFFVHMSVHMNHVPYQRHLAHLKHPYPTPNSLEQEYLNSVFEQDHCMGEFLDHVKSLNRPDLHVLIAGDHGYPIDQSGGMRDHFMTSLFFLPATNRKAEFAPGLRNQIVPAQVQILPTVLELFGTQPSPYSFLPILKGQQPSPAYRDCHLVADFGLNLAFVTYGSQVVARRVRANRFYGYNFDEQGRIGPAIGLHKRSDWDQFQLPAYCMQKLGAPGY